MTFHLPTGWTTERASGWWELHHLRHDSCGWQTARAYDLVLDPGPAQRAVYGHTCAGGDPGRYVVQRTEEQLWTVGYHDAAGNWHPDSDHGDPAEAQTVADQLNEE